MKGVCPVMHPFIAMARCEKEANHNGAHAACGDVWRESKLGSHSENCECSDCYRVYVHTSGYAAGVEAERTRCGALIRHEATYRKRDSIAYSALIHLAEKIERGE